MKFTESEHSVMLEHCLSKYVSSAVSQVEDPRPYQITARTNSGFLLMTSICAHARTVWNFLQYMTWVAWWGQHQAQAPGRLPRDLIPSSSPPRSSPWRLGFSLRNERIQSSPNGMTKPALCPGQLSEMPPCLLQSDLLSMWHRLSVPWPTWALVFDFSVLEYLHAHRALSWGWHQLWARPPHTHHYKTASVRLCWLHPLARSVVGFSARDVIPTPRKLHTWLVWSSWIRAVQAVLSNVLQHYD